MHNALLHELSQYVFSMRVLRSGVKQMKFLTGNTCVQFICLEKFDMIFDTIRFIIKYEFEGFLRVAVEKLLLLYIYWLGHCVTLGYNVSKIIRYIESEALCFNL
jgi:hypothetical protein